MSDSITTAIYPGTFDPITNGHIDIIKRGLLLFDKIVVAVAQNSSKQPIFTLEERCSITADVLKDFPNVSIIAVDGLLIETARKINASAIIRGLRTVTDFEYEFQMAMMNKRMNPDIETVFLMTGESVFFVHSKTIKEVLSYGGTTNGLLPAEVEILVKQRLEKRKKKCDEAK